MKKYIMAACLAACMCSNTDLYAQSKEIIFGSSSHSTSSGSHGRSRKHDSKSDDGKNAITTGMISWLNGYQPVYYERALTSFLSVRVGAGVTFRSFGNDFGQLAFDDGEAKSQTDITDDKGKTIGTLYDIRDDYASYAHRTCKIGTYFSIAPRLYFSDNVMNGFTLFPMLEFKQFKYNALFADTKTVTNGFSSPYDDVEVPRTTTGMNESVKCIDFTINVGGNFQAPSHLDFAWHVGFGIRNMKASRLNIKYQSYDNNNTSNYVNTTYDYSKMRPLFSADFCVGGWY